MKRNIFLSFILIFFIAGCNSNKTIYNSSPRVKIHQYSPPRNHEHAIKKLEKKITNITKRENYSHTIFCLDLLELDKKPNKFISKQPHISNAQYNFRSSEEEPFKLTRIQSLYQAKLNNITKDKKKVEANLNKNATTKIKELQLFVRRFYQQIVSHRIRHTNPVREIVYKLDQYLTKSRKNINKLTLNQKLNILTKSITVIENLPTGLPIENYRVTSRFKIRMHPIKKRRKMHTGIDLVGKKYSPIFATANGEVIFAGRQRGYGKTVIIQHSKGSSTLYAHLNTIHVKKGSKVKLGQKIGLQGNSGRSTNDHLHYEVRLKNQPVNPEIFAKF